MVIQPRSPAYVRYLVVILLLLSSLFFGILWLLEVKLESDHAREWTEKSKAVQPYYWWQFLTHDGRDIGYEHKGPLKLALHPFAIYSNLPNPGFRALHNRRERFSKHWVR
ncbi:MAG: hypothetical protein K0S58_895 [Nitrospira sp.]|jgi:hypothetical protein|nr:hypothetical protein [Nitrospira sp.]